MKLGLRITPKPIVNAKEQRFVTYVRTMMLLQQRFKDKGLEPIHIKKSEIEKRFFPYPIFNAKNEIQKLVDEGEIEVTINQSENGKPYHTYKALKPGFCSPEFIHERGKDLDDITSTMLTFLSMVDLPSQALRTPYFDAFLKLKDKFIRSFFTVDGFSERVHTPITSFNSEFRKNILIDGDETTSLDVVTMQPILLGKILKTQIGENEFSQWIDSGEDIYLILMNKAGLRNRDEGKERFFQILFGKSNQKLSKMFGDANWIQWINEYKSRPEINNPRTIEKHHSNLAWLLQSTEVDLMRKVWKRLIDENIPFLSVHDEVIIQKKHLDKSYSIFDSVLSEHLTYYRIKGKAPQTIEAPQHEPQPEIEQNIFRTIEKLNEDLLSKGLNTTELIYKPCFERLNTPIEQTFTDGIYCFTAQELKEWNLAPEQFFHSFPNEVDF